MFEIVLDPIFPPIDYKPVAEKNFQLIHKEPSAFRLTGARGKSSRKNSLYPD